MPSGQSQNIAGHIIIVGAEPSEHKALVTILSHGGFDVTSAPNGQAALAQNPPADLILLDIHSSNLNEIEECRCLKNDTRTRTIPVVFLCDQQDTDAKARGYAAGCADCLSKPYLTEEVLRRVRTHIALYRTQNHFDDSIETPDRQPQSTENQQLESSTRLSEGSAGLSDGETDLANRLLFEQMISDLSARFIHLPSEQLDDEIECALKMVLEFFQVDRCGLLQILPDKSAWKITHAAYSEHTSPVPVGTELPQSINPWGFDKLAVKREVVSFARVDDMPDEAHVDKQTWTDWGIRSNLTVPILASGSVVHIISINAVQRERVWPEAFIPRLQLLGEVFVNALERRKAEQALHDSEERLSLAASSAEAGLWVMTVDTGRIWATHKTREILNFDPNESLSFERFLEIIHPDDRESAKETLARCLQTRDLVSLQYRVVAPDGQVRWVESSGRSYPATPDQPERLMGVAIDITRRKELEANLVERIDEIQRLRDKLENENIYLRDEITLQQGHKGIVGHSKAMKRVLTQVEQVADTEATVLLQGETGTGKDLIAREIHRLSNRKNRPLVTINCAVLPPTLIESELFGREKGAYTGAMTRMAGRFEVADQSTLFLNEIDELSPDLQAKLLRVLEEGRFERLGSTKSLKVNVRIIAATHRDLSQEVAGGRFRSDLYYRLNVFPILIPPLRERPLDIPPLIWSFIKRYEKKIGKRIDHIPRKNLEAMQHYPWPGNARELRNIVEHAMITSQGGTLHLRRPHPASEEVAASDRLEDVERVHILGVLKRTGWRITGKGGADEILGMKRTTLQSKMKKLGIQRPTP